jgi:hypothetical protein
LTIKKGARTRTSDKSESEQLKKDLESSLKKQVTNEPVDGTSLEDLSSAERIIIEATKLRKIQRKITYRVLYPDDNAEIAMIINHDISAALARAALPFLTAHARKLHDKENTELSLGAKIFLEYQVLIEKQGWTMKDVMQQTTYDFNITWLMMKKEKPGTDLYKYAEKFQDGLIEYIRKPDTKIQEFLSQFNVSLDINSLPFSIYEGFEKEYSKSCKHIDDANKAWNKRLFNLDTDNFTGVLICFWCVSFLSGYWQELNRYYELRSFKRKHRDELIVTYIQGIEKYLPSLYMANEITPRMLKKFLEYIKDNFSRYR